MEMNLVVPGIQNFWQNLLTIGKQKIRGEFIQELPDSPHLKKMITITSRYPRIQQWGEELKSIINGEPPRTDYDWSERISKNIPVVSHEIGQWCVYPNLKEIEKYNGVLKARNFEIFIASFEAHHMEHLTDSFLFASGKLQALCYKAEIEAALRTPGFAGFQLLDLHDFPGQGTALVGVLDPFWEVKGYITPDEYKRFCNETVPLARFSKRIFLSNEKISVPVLIAHFGEQTLENVEPVWKIEDSDANVLEQGRFESLNIPIGNDLIIGTVYTTIKTDTPQQLKLSINVSGFENSWDFWLYPIIVQELKTDSQVYITQQFDNSAKEILEQGGNVLLTLKKGSILPEKGGNIGVGFSSIFWNTAWTEARNHIIWESCVILIILL